MKRFAFPLQNVLEFRKMRAEAEEARRFQIAAELGAIEFWMANLDREKQEAEEAVTRPGPVDPVMLGALDGFRQQIDRKKRQLARKAVECRARLTEQDRKLRAARQGWKVIENLRDRRLLEWKREVDKEQETMAGELHLARLVRERSRERH